MMLPRWREVARRDHVRKFFVSLSCLFLLKDKHC